MNFGNLFNLSNDKNLDKKIAAGFNERLDKREVAYKEKAKSQAPTEKFFSRSYNL